MNVMNSEHVSPYQETLHRQLEALVASGLATKRTATVNVREFFTVPPTSMQVREDVYDRGSEYAKYAGKADGPGGIGELCFATLQVDHIDHFSEPGQMMGATMSQVQYHAKVTGMANWATTPSMRSAFPTIESQVQQATDAERTEVVVLMNDGWQAQ